MLVVRDDRPVAVQTLFSVDTEKFQELTGKLGWFIAEGERWRTIRKGGSHMFSQRKLKYAARIV